MTRKEILHAWKKFFKLSGLQKPQIEIETTEMRILPSIKSQVAFMRYCISDGGANFENI